MKILSIFFLVATIFLAPFLNAQQNEIIRLQDLRDARGLRPFLQHKNADVRARAAFACGSVQDTTLIRLLVSMLKDRDVGVRIASAFALGQLNFVVDSSQRTLLSRSLIAALARKQSKAVALRSIETLGKVGDGKSLNELIGLLRILRDSDLSSEAALSVGRYAFRGIKSDDATAFVGKRLAETADWQSSYAMMRIADPKFLAQFETALLNALPVSDADTRMFSATALGNLVNSSVVVGALLDRVNLDDDWRVRVNALRAVGRAKSEHAIKAVPSLLIAVASPIELISLTALNVLGAMPVADSDFMAATKKTLVEVLTNSDRYSNRQKKEAATSLVRLLGNEGFRIVEDRYRKGILPRSAVLPAYGYATSSDALNELLDGSLSTNVRDQMAALESLLNWSKRSQTDSITLSKVRSVFRNCVSSQDMAVITTAAAGLADSIFAHEESIPDLLAALENLKSPDDVEPIVEIIRTLGILRAAGSEEALLLRLSDADRTVALAAASALKQITGKDYSQRIAPHTKPTYTNFDWELLPAVRENPNVILNTSRGRIAMRLLPDEAPFTCINFALLIRRGFFNRLTFHRVVPNFVVQGGDPRGDGWGGPGYAIRSEFGFEHYERGMVGVASAGKDTEGCQLFITHSRQPHLDGRYTIFARVTEGMEIVDQLQIGDIIESVSFAEVPGVLKK